MPYATPDSATEADDINSLVKKLALSKAPIELTLIPKPVNAAPASETLLKFQEDPLRVFITVFRLAKPVVLKSE